MTRKNREKKMQALERHRMRHMYRLCFWTLLAFSCVLFFWQIETPLKYVYDEFHYIPAAKAMLEGEIRNREHPPFAKYLFALSIKAFGDRPLGWRIPSVIAGVATLAGVLELSWIFFATPFWTLFCGLLTLFDFVLFVQSRIAMLDSIMTAFLIWALVFTAKAYFDGRRKDHLIAGVLFGFSIAAKWSPVPAMAFCMALLAVRSYRKRLTLKPIFYLAGSALTVYFLTFLPLLFFSREHLILSSLFYIQKEMFALHMSLHSPHTYSSQWWQWPLLFRPMWYAFDKSGDVVRGVFIVGNPAIFIAGFFVMLSIIWRTLKTYPHVELLISFYYLALYIPWSWFPRETSFFYYYYPASLMLGPALTLIFKRWDDRTHGYRAKLWACIFLAFSLSLFFDFYPILAGIPLSPLAFQRWVWFRSWL